MASDMVTTTDIAISSLKVTNGRHRFKKAQMPEQINSVRFVQLLVVQAERAWAYGLTLKSEHALGESRALGRVRHRYVQKFYRAAYWAGEVVELAKKACDPRTVLEAEAYHLWLHGLALTEDGKYESAMMHLNQSVEKYNKLISTSLDVIIPNASKAFKHRISDLEPTLRVCKYRLRIGQAAMAQPFEKAESAASPKSAGDGFESANEMSEGEVDFSSSDDEMDFADDVVRSPKNGETGKTGLLGKIGGWWSKN